MKYFKGFVSMMSSSFNIQYQSTGVGSLSLLDKIEPTQSLLGLFQCVEFDIIVIVKLFFDAPGFLIIFFKFNIDTLQQGAVPLSAPLIVGSSSSNSSNNSLIKLLQLVLLSVMIDYSVRLLSVDHSHCFILDYFSVWQLQKSLFDDAPYSIHHIFGFRQWYILFGIFKN